MATAGYGAGQADQSRAMIAHVKTLLNARLKEVLRREGLQVSGIKSELQIRIIAHIEKLSNAGDTSGLQRVRNRIYGQYNEYNYSSPESAYSSYTPPSSASPQYLTPSSSYPHHSGNPRTMSNYPHYSNRVTFKDSPFYEIVRPLTPVIECKARESTRDTARAQFDLPPDVADQLNRDTNYRVMVFCTADSALPSFSQSDISFPHQVELKCNGNEVKANLRGLKNKPGSTRPADITSFLRKKVPSHQNILEMVYALTNKVSAPFPYDRHLLVSDPSKKDDPAKQAKPAMQKYLLVTNLVRKIPVETLVSQLKAGRIITKDRVIKEMTSKAQDSDIVATSTVLSLKCPLSAMRIATPCRSTACTHNQCFDAASYLQLQEQAPTWTCPICNKIAPFKNLLVDLYVDNILKTTLSNIEQVTIEPDGTWHQQKPSEGDRQKKNFTPDDDEDENDLIELQDDRVSSLRHDARTLGSVRTPPMSSREQSNVSSSAPRSNKRPASEVIDLTLSDDDAPPPSKIKRPSLSSSDILRPSASNFQFNLLSTITRNYEHSPL